MLNRTTVDRDHGEDAPQVPRPGIRTSALVDDSANR